MKFIPFRLKILGGFLTLLVAVLAASLAVVSRIQTRRAEDEVRRQLEVTRTVFVSILKYRERQLLSAARLLVGDFAFKQALSTKDPKTIESAALSLQSRIGAGAVWVTDDEGTLYADTTHQMKPGDSVKSWPAVASALEGEAKAAIVPVKGRAYQAAAVPVNAPDLIGVVVAVFPIDDALAAELKRMTLSEVSFEAQGNLFASTLPPDDRGVLEKNRGMPEDTIHLMGPMGKRYIVLPVSPAKGVMAYIQRSWDEALLPLQEQRRLLVGVGLAGVGLMAVFGFLLAEGVTKSVRTLVKATLRLVDGDYSVRVDIRSRDEIGQLGGAFNSMVEGLQEKEKIRSVLRKAVSKEIADELLKRGEINLGGEERTITVLFSDIRGFTTISEGLAPPELVSQLNGYFIAMSRAIEERKGVIDKFIGDAVMALFGAPLTTPEDADNAQRAALGMVGALESYNSERRAKGLSEWRNGIGLNTGRAIAGTMGSEDRWSYTVIGDSVNLASRLEALTKHYGVRILVSGATRAVSKADFRYRTLDLVRVKGKNEPVEVFELLGEGGQAPAWLETYEEAVRLYRNREFAPAKTRFETVTAQAPEDRASRLYLERIEPLLQGVAPDWEPAHTMTEK